MGSFHFCSGSNAMQSSKEAARLFELFIIRTVRLDEMQKSSANLLSVYQEELGWCIASLLREELSRIVLRISCDKFRRVPLHETSNVVADIFKNNSTLRVANYKEAGGHHAYLDQQIAVKLDASIKGLRSHIPQAQKVVEELQELVEKVTCMMDHDLELLLEKVGLGTSAMDQNECVLGEDVDSKVFALVERQTSDYATIMSGILSMLEKDLQMQEMVVADLRLDTDSGCLQAYSQMWALRPFVDERLIQEALNWVGKKATVGTPTQL